MCYVFICISQSICLLLCCESHHAAPITQGKQICLFNLREFDHHQTVLKKQTDLALKEKHIHNNEKTLLITFNLNLEISFRKLATGSCELTATLAAAFYLSLTLTTKSGFLLVWFIL